MKRQHAGCRQGRTRSRALAPAPVGWSLGIGTSGSVPGRRYPGSVSGVVPGDWRLWGTGTPAGIGQGRWVASSSRSSGAGWRWQEGAGGGAVAVGAASLRRISHAAGGGGLRVRGLRQLRPLAAGTCPRSLPRVSGPVFAPGLHAPSFPLAQAEVWGGAGAAIPLRRGWQEGAWPGRPRFGRRRLSRRCVGRTPCPPQRTLRYAESAGGSSPPARPARRGRR